MFKASSIQHPGSHSTLTAGFDAGLPYDVPLEMLFKGQLWQVSSCRLYKLAAVDYTNETRHFTLHFTPIHSAPAWQAITFSNFFH